MKNKLIIAIMALALSAPVSATTPPEEVSTTTAEVASETAMCLPMRVFMIRELMQLTPQWRHVLMQAV